VAVLHTASVIWWWLAAPVEHLQHPITLAACNTATRHVPPALALAPKYIIIYIILTDV